MFLFLSEARYTTEAETKHGAIRAAYTTKHGSKKQTIDVLNQGTHERNPNIVTMADVRQWYLNKASEQSKAKTV